MAKKEYELDFSNWEQDKKIRSNLYRDSAFTVVMNPTESLDYQPQVVDLTIDATNHTRAYHINTDDVRDMMAGASFVVCDNEHLANEVRGIVRNTTITTAMFGYCGRVDMQNDEGLLVGLLNNTPDYQINNEGARRMLKSLSDHYLIYGEPITGIEDYEIEEVFDVFAARCDILLLPSLPQVHNSITLPLSVMMAGTAVVAANARGYYSLSAASGVMLANNLRVSAWKKHLEYLLKDARRLDELKRLNSRFVQSVTAESYGRIAKIERRLAAMQEAIAA